MKAKKFGSCYRVNVSESDCERFAKTWPCSGLRYGDRFAFTFEEKTGDLVDVECFCTRGPDDSPSVDQEALRALSEDAQTYAKQTLAK